MKLEHIPSKYRLLVQKAMDGKLSPRKAIKMKCYNCMGYEDVSKRVRECNTKTCPLHHYRPFQEVENESK